MPRLPFKGLPRKRALLLLLLLGMVLGILLLAFRFSLARQREAHLEDPSSGVLGPGAALLSSFLPAPPPPPRKVVKTMGLNLKEIVPAMLDGQPAPQKLIRNGEVFLVVRDFDKAFTAMQQMSAALGGYVTDTDIQRSPTGTRTGHATLRVPSISFQQAGSRLRALGTLTSEKVTVQDVTRDYMDLESRLRIKQEALGRLRELLRVRSGNLEELLSIQKEITELSQDIEASEGMRRYFDHQVQFSTLQVEWTDLDSSVPSQPKFWQPLADAFRDAGGMLANSVAFLFRLILVLIPWALLGWGAFWGYRRRKRAASPKASQGAGEP